MSRWRNLQKKLISESMHDDKIDVAHKDISSGKIHGTIYYKEGARYTKGVLLVHGFSGNRHSFQVLAERLVSYGYFCLSIDLPSHYVNRSSFSLGEVSESITDGVNVLKHHYGMKSVAVIGHSLGATGAIFANAGYTKRIESECYSLWEGMSASTERFAEDLAAGRTDKAVQAGRNIEAHYEKLKQLILESLKEGIQQHAGVACYIFLAPPLDSKGAIPALSLLRRFKHQRLKTITDRFLHKPLVKQLYKEGNPGGYEASQDPSLVQMQFFRTHEPYEFLDYFLHMREPKDYLRLIEDFAAFKRHEGRTNLFEYYQKKYLYPKPKLFIYGKRDMLLRSFLPFERRRLEDFYRSCGNAEVHHGSFSHIMVENPKQHVGFMAIKDEWVTEVIFRFLDKHC